MDRAAIFVDAGYLCTGGGCAAAARDDVKRAEVSLHVDEVAALIEAKARSLTGVPLLRVYWYDGAILNRLTTEQQLVAHRDSFKLRLGIINGDGEQKEVDTKLVTDLTELARNRAVSDAVLLGSDGDLRLGVELAQQFGVRVHLLTIEGTRVSEQLCMEADSWTEITVDEIRTLLTVTPPPPRAAAPNDAARTAAQADPARALREVAQAYVDLLGDNDRTNLTTALGRPNSLIPADHDGRLLNRARDAFGRDLERQEVHEIRACLRHSLNIGEAVPQAPRYR
ncbi:MAG: NYN domain-containing protein [Burkholderiaceae bacterium]